MKFFIETLGTYSSIVLLTIYDKKKFDFLSHLNLFPPLNVKSSRARRNSPKRKRDDEMSYRPAKSNPVSLPPYATSAEKRRRVGTMASDEAIIVEVVVYLVLADRIRVKYYSITNAFLDMVSLKMSLRVER